MNGGILSFAFEILAPAFLLSAKLIIEAMFCLTQTAALQIQIESWNSAKKLSLRTKRLIKRNQRKPSFMPLAFIVH